MDAPVKTITVEQFDEFIKLPENADKLFEFIGGEIFEVPSNPLSSEIAITISFFIKLFLRQNNIKGHVTGEAGGYMVSGERYAPDVAYISSEKQAELANDTYNPEPPELAVEVMSPSDTDKRMLVKVANYLAAGTLVWVVYPASKQVEVYASGKPVQIIGRDGTLDGGNVLKGFELKVSEIFPEES